MLSDTFFLQPNELSVEFEPTWASATGTALIFNQTQIPSGVFVSGETNGSIEQGKGVITALVETLLINQPTFGELLTQALGISLDNSDQSFEADGSSQATIITTFPVEAGETFTFDFFTAIELVSDEIETPTQENLATSQTLFLLLDVSNPDNTQLVDYLELSSILISAQQVWELNLESSDNFNITLVTEDVDIDGDNTVDFVEVAVIGDYEKYFLDPTKLTFIAISNSQIEFAGDDLIGRLGSDVIYGSVWNDQIVATKKKDQIYASLGDDTIHGGDGDDIIEGGGGNDWLYGGKKKDKLYGSVGNDHLDGGDDKDEMIGGLGNDTMVGGKGDDKFIFVYNDSLQLEEYDVIKDFEVGKDEIEFHHWETLDVMAEGTMTETIEGVVFNIPDGGRILFEGLTAQELETAFKQKKKLKGTKENDQLFGGLDSDKLKGHKGNDALYGYSGDDKLEGKEGNDLIVAGRGNDEAKGGKGNDSLIGVDPTQTLAGVDEIDKLKGEKGADLFVLGDTNQAYYDDGNLVSNGYQDYALIEDFKPSDFDRIQLHGVLDNYHFESASSSLPEGTAIFLETGQEKELIAILKKVSLEEINSTIFTFT